jgi:hypothetical protein
VVAEDDGMTGEVHLLADRVGGAMPGHVARRYIGRTTYVDLDYCAGRGQASSRPRSRRRRTNDGGTGQYQEAAARRWQRAPRRDRGPGAGPGDAQATAAQEDVDDQARGPGQPDRPKTVYDYARLIRTHIVPSLGAIQVQTLTLDALHVLQ